MENIEKRGLPNYLRAYVAYKASKDGTINRELFKEIPVALKEYVDYLFDGGTAPAQEDIIGFPLVYKEYIIENIPEEETDDDDDDNA